MTLGYVVFEFHTSLKIRVRTAWQKICKKEIDHLPDLKMPRVFVLHTFRSNLP